MSSSDTTLEDFDSPPRKGATGFVVLIVLALLAGMAALYAGHAPISDKFVEDWISWARIETTWAGLLASAAVMLLIGFIGAAVRTFSRPAARPVARLRPVTPLRPASAQSPDPVLPSPVLNLPAAAVTARIAEPEAETMAIPASLLGEPPSIEVSSLEPAIFHDNASDSFLTRDPVTVQAATGAEPVMAFDSHAAFADSHGLHIGGGAQIIPFRPVETAVPEARDPVEAALLAEPAMAPTPAPPSDMGAVIASAMHFAGEPATPATGGAPIVEAAAEPAAAEPAAIDDQSEIRQATQMALSVWPDTTRAIAGDELGVRIAHLYYDTSPESVRAFHLIATGDLAAAAAALQSHADGLAQTGRASEAAEAWRIFAALHMGRDDGKAMTAYEKVSELDPADANIHLYLARRYQMAGDTGKMLPVLGRALGVISDPMTRAELLAPYADLKMKAGDPRAAGDAFEELSRLHETTAYLKPDDVAAHSAHAITLARLAQAREMHGAYDQAGPLYKKAHQVFADLSARKPDHSGLRAMTENALKDAQRFHQG